MKVLYLINNLDGGGAEKLVSELVSLLNKKIHIDIVLLNNENGKYFKKLKSQGINISVLSLHKYSTKIIFKLIRHIKNNNYDVIHVHLFPSLYYGAILSFFSKNRFIFTEHSTSNKRRKLLIFRILDTIIYNRYETITCISDATKVNLSNFLLSTKKLNLRVIPNGIPLPVNAKPRNITSMNSINLIMIGRFEYPKDQETVIKALKHLPKNIELFFAGTGKNENYCKKLTKSENIEDRVHFLGFVNDINKLLVDMDIAVLSSHYEGFGMAAVESMAIGVPTIVANVPGLVNVISNGGLLFEKGNPIDLANKVTKLIYNKRMYNSISKKGIKRAKLYDINRISNSYLSLYTLQIN